MEEVKFEKFDEEDFIIEEVKKVEDKFMVNIIFKTRKYTISPKEVILPEKRSGERRIAALRKIYQILGLIIQLIYFLKV